MDKAADAIAGTIKTIMQLKDMLMGVLAKAASAVEKIISDPIGFLGNLVSGIKQGFDNFAGNIITHLQTGLMGWLTGAMGAMGLQLPDDIFSLQGIFSLVTQILGTTWNYIRMKAVKMFGEPIVKGMEKSVEIFQIIANKGPMGLWEHVQEHFNDLKETVIEEIKGMLITQVITAGVKWIIGLLNPASAFVKAAMAIYDIVMFFVNQGSQVVELVSAVTDAVVAIASGAVGGAAKLVENALAKSLPVVIGFLASLLGIGDLAKKVQGIVGKIRQRIDLAIDKVLQKAKKLLMKGKKGVKDLKEKGLASIQWWKQKNKFKNNAGESHTLFFTGKGKSANLMIASTPTEIEKYLDDQEQIYKEDASKIQKIKEARNIHQQVKNITRAEVKPEDAEAITKNLEKLSVLLIELCGSTAEDVELPAKADWSFGGGANKFAQVEKLSTKTSTGGTARSSSSSPNGFHILRKNQLTENGNWLQMHMISHTVGGKAEDQNLIPAPREVNSSGQVRSFENAVKNLVENKDKKTQKPNVIWIKTEVNSFHPASTTSTVSYGSTDFVESISMRAGLHFYSQGQW